MELIIGGRRYGKTTQALEWVDQAERIKGYPFWSRVLLVVNSHEADRLRKLLRDRAEARGEGDPAGLIYNKVYCVEEWKTAKVGANDVDVMLDNADLVLASLFNRRGSRLAGATWTARDQPEDKIVVLDDQGGSIEVR
jgi:hypothetical protein